jgi:hypothetical protein
VWSALALLGAIPVFVVYARPLHTAPNYDEEVYLATMRELRHGAAIGDVFLSQPPGFGWFLDAIGTVSGSLATVRALMIGVALLGCLAAWFIGRRAGGALGGAIAAATLALAPPWATNASRLEAEVPSTTLSVTALALVPRYPALAGAAFALAVSVKLLAISVAVPLVLLGRRRLVPLALGAAAATAVVLLTVASQLGEVWQQVVALHEAGRKNTAALAHNAPTAPFSENIHRVVHFLDLRTPFAALALTALLLSLLLVLKRRPFDWELWTWPLAAAAVIAAQRPLLDHHMDVLAAAWAIPVGATLARAVTSVHGKARVGAVAAFSLTVVAGLGQEWKHLPPTRESPDVVAAVARLRTLVPAGSLVATDHQIVPYLAGDRQPPDLVDVSQVRIQSAELTLAALLQESAGARAFVVGRALSGNATLLAALGRRYRTRIDIGSVTIFANPRR